MPAQTLETQMAADGPQTTADEGRRAVLNAISYEVIGSGHKVLATLGPGFLEKVYENALAVELRRRGLRVDQQPPVDVRYEGELVGIYTPDLLVERRLLVELKVSTFIERTHRIQCIHYLKATGLSLCILVNFGNPRLEVCRIVHRF